MATASKVNKKYLRMTPVVKSIYEDLELYQDWVRMQYPAVKFDPADLYKNSSPLWQKYMKYQRNQARKNEAR